MGTLRLGYPRLLVVGRGGTARIATIDEFTEVTFTRVLSEVGTATVKIADPSPNCCEALRRIRTVGHELVIERGGYRVWEGPIVRIRFTPGEVELEARDIGWYLERHVVEKRIDPDRIPVLDVCGQAISDALGGVFTPNVPGSGQPPTWTDPYTYNVAQWSRVIRGTSDARTKQKVVKYAETVMDLLQRFVDRGALRFAVMGRRVIMWDGLVKPQTLPAMSDADFTDDLWVEENGKDMATRGFVTDNSTDGDDTIDKAVAGPQALAFFAEIDNVYSDVREERGDQRADQNKRRLESMYPPGLELGIPDGAGLRECAPVFLNELMPGSQVLVKAARTCRSVSANRIVVEVTATWALGGDRVSVTFGEPGAELQPPDPANPVDDVRGDMVERANNAAAALARGPGVPAGGGGPVVGPGGGARGGP